MHPKERAFGAASRGVHAAPSPHFRRTVFRMNPPSCIRKNLGRLLVEFTPHPPPPHSHFRRGVLSKLNPTATQLDMELLPCVFAFRHDSWGRRRRPGGDSPHPSLPPQSIKRNESHCHPIGHGAVAVCVCLWARQQARPTRVRAATSPSLPPQCIKQNESHCDPTAVAVLFACR